MNRHAAIPMADSASDQTPAARALAATCRHLRSNGMYIFDRLPDGDDDDDYQPSACWCLHTMKNYGPDDDFVGRRECRDPGRSCYEPL